MSMLSTHWLKAGVAMSAVRKASPTCLGFWPKGLAKCMAAVQAKSP
ncbi:MAG: hypothetical protein RLZZ239_2312 [Pseudomonadota bacterium]